MGRLSRFLESLVSRLVDCIDDLLRALSRWEAAREKERSKKEKERLERAEKRREELRRLKQQQLANPDLNTDDWELHWERLRRYGRSCYGGEMIFMGPRGGIYTVTARGNRNYR
jgi:hypothetical protein